MEVGLKEYFSEILTVIAISKKTQWAIILGVVFFIGISLIGSHLTSNLQFTGPLKGLEDAVAGKLLKRYDKVALFALISFWVLAFKCYHRDKKRLW
ncbi:hypothetical protein [Halomonas sp. KO116]|uniref:hypothetical protein n=1 Tax=Halomonas sp. KO116 TaxID=1504981 RepID=UPI0004E3BC13|nr:hypothetical protein [Halomonas sp. KO116]AJY50435.1 hypothetical protein KO116_01954 [Halomonas sp. KO116]